MSSPLTERRQQATPRGVAVLCDFYADRACNAELWDEQGRRHIDFAGGIGVLNSGHLHPQVVAAAAGDGMHLGGQEVFHAGGAAKRWMSASRVKRSRGTGGRCPSLPRCSA